MADLSLKPGTALRETDSLNRRDLPRLSPRSDRPGWAGKLTQGIKTFLWVAPLTILLWVYAEQEKLDRPKDVPARIDVRGSSSDRIVTLLSSRDISLDLEGPNAGVEQVSSALRDGRPLEVIVNEQPPFEGDISITERLNNTDLFTRNAVSVKRASPVRVRVEARVHQDVPLIVKADQKHIAKIVDPATVSIDGPDSVVRDKRIVAIGDLSGLANKDVVDGAAELPVGLFIGDGNSFSPLTNSLVLFPRTVRAKIETPKVTIVKKTLTKSIPIVVEAPAVYLAPLSSTDESYRLKLDKVNLPNITVSGPPEAVEQLIGATSKFSAAVILRLTTENFHTAGQQEAKLNPDTDFIMPPGVKVVDAPRISFTITKTTN